jgi:predicted Rossmann fold flavoprotein
VETVLNAHRIAVERAIDGGFRVACSLGEFTADALVVATGGLSIPKLGATGIGYELARQLNLQVVSPRPALVPLLLGGEDTAWTELAGVAAEVVVRTHGTGRKAEFREKMLLTHRGLSGPAVLQASSYWRAGDELQVDFAPETKVLGKLMEPKAVRGDASLRQALREALPQRLAGLLADKCDTEGWSNAALEVCERRLHAWKFHPTDTGGFEKAEVTAGGVDTSELKARTMEARSVPGLFFIGEAVDVTGWLGGFNFQWAWASGVAAGRAV